MEQFEKVTVVKKANIYFDGNVTSRTVIFENGEKKPLSYNTNGLLHIVTSPSKTERWLFD